MQDTKTLKQNFLDALQNADSLAEALEISALPKNLLCGFLLKDKSFQKAFDKIINLKLEIALIDTTLKSKAAGVLSFSLSNRVPQKYNKTKKESEGNGPQKTQKIVYVNEE